MMVKNKVTSFLESVFKLHGNGHQTVDAFVSAAMHTPSDFLGGLTPSSYLEQSDPAETEETEETEDYVLEVMKILYQ